MGTATATDVNDNLQTAFTGLAEHIPDGAVEEFGPLTVASSGLPVALFNRVFVFEPPARETLADAVAWQADRELPFWVTFTDVILTDVEALPADVGLTQTEKSDPGMVLPSLDHIPPNESSAVIEEVTTSEALDDFNTVAAAAFEMPLEVTEPVYQAALAGDNKR